jgi:hypothetical protein
MNVKELRDTTKKETEILFNELRALAEASARRCKQLTTELATLPPLRVARRSFAFLKSQS